MTGPRLDLTRTQVLAYRRNVGALDERLPPGLSSLRRAGWAGLQDSVPRAAPLSIHARVAGTAASTLADSSLVQLWGPRFSAWRRLSRVERDAVEAEAASLPLPGIERRITVRWNG